jgi:ABC-type multidrug transport system ATPase subunit
MTGIIPPTSGRVRIAGFDLMEQPLEAKRRLAFVPDEPRLFDYLTAWDHLIVTARLYGVPDGATGPSSSWTSSSSAIVATATRRNCPAG